MEKKIKAKDAAEALRIAAKEFDTDQDKVYIKDVEIVKRGFFKKDETIYLVELKKTYNSDDEFGKEIALDELSEPVLKKIDQAKQYLKNILRYFGLEDLNINVKATDRHIYLLLEGNKHLGGFIGPKGSTLDAVQYLLNLSVGKKGTNRVRFLIDSDNYRKQKDESLKRMARRAVKKVVEQNRRITLDPMNPYDRRIVHTAVGENRQAASKSMGKEPNRRVVIYKKDDETEVLEYVKRREKEGVKPYRKRGSRYSKTAPKKMTLNYDFEREFLKRSADAKLYEKINNASADRPEDDNADQGKQD